MTLREKTELIEERELSPLACLAKNSRGRERELLPCPLRTCFSRDRDRIIHSKSFRRLMHKTQVFLSPEGDHYRTRLTHTIEVSQIARTISRGLRLNEDLTEAIAMGHDLGHTPFGHAGERALSEVCSKPFVHAEQSVRVVKRLERDGKGLNLTYEVVDGIACHSGGDGANGATASENPCWESSRGAKAGTLEGQVVMFSDKVAYLTHDIDDAIRGGIISERDIPWDLQYTLGRSCSERLTTMITSLIENSGGEIRMDGEIHKAFLGLRSFMFEAVYRNPRAKGEEGRAEAVVKELFSYFCRNRDELPQEYRAVLEEEGAERAVCDYISGMSDRYAISTFESLFVPKSWGYK